MTSLPPGIETASALLFDTARKLPDNDLFVVPRWLMEKWGLPAPAIRYREVATSVEALAERYRRAGYGAGHRVALLLENRPNHFLHFMALNAVGAVVMGIAYCYFGARLARMGLPMNAPRSKQRARQLLQASIIYLPLLFALMMINVVK